MRKCDSQKLQGLCATCVATRGQTVLSRMANQVLNALYLAGEVIGAIGASSHSMVISRFTLLSTARRRRCSSKQVMYSASPLLRLRPPRESVTPSEVAQEASYSGGPSPPSRSPQFSCLWCDLLPILEAQVAFLAAVWDPPSPCPLGPPRRA